ncbi:MAG: DNA-directed RNA polymerase subunit beta' [Minisyncoccia bacterium]
MNIKPQKDYQTTDFDNLQLKLASPERIKEWSFGEVTKPETINYRTQRSERNGLFDEKIFGPDKDYECYCGKYRGIRYKGIVCEKCGVEITRSIVRRERMGHIELAAPVCHIWFLKSMPSRLALITGVPAGDLEKVIYFAGYIVVKVNTNEKDRILKDLDSEFKAKVKSLQDDKSKEHLKGLFQETKNDIESIQVGKVLDEVAYHNFSMKYATLFEASIGSDPIFEMLKNIDLKKLLAELEGRIEKASAAETPKLIKRISLIRQMILNNVRPEWMFMVRIPVIPPALRPMVPLDGGRYATSDVNDLYRRVINRNNRLKKLKEIMAPDVILRNEKRILQEAVDALIDNTIRHSGGAGAVNQSQRRPLKSLSDNLKGKRGLFRQNLLGKRVDYSGRSVIVVGPELNLDECGLPKHMALELFKPFVIAELLKRELAYNIRGAGRLIEDGIPEVWAILEDIIKDKYVLLNRAPTLHRLSIQAFRPVLVEGNAIQVHPLVCTAFNADFDGDQMAVHVPLSPEAQLEAREVMASNKNILKPGSGEPTVIAKLLDVVLGAYWMTKDVPGEKGEGKAFSSPNSAITAFDFGELSLRAKIKVLPKKGNVKYSQFNDALFETTVGRLLFNSVLPVDYPFVNTAIDRKRMSALFENLISLYGIGAIPNILDKIKSFSFKYALHSGITWGIDDVRIPDGKGAIVDAAQKKSDGVREEFNQGLISEEERLEKNTEIWQGAKGEVEKLLPATLGVHDSVQDMIQSGARGSISNITQMVGMKGLITNTQGETIEFPIISCMKEGLTPIEYFITTHGSRKGLTDTALNTARAGYLTRRLFDVSQDVVVTLDDCGTKKGIAISSLSASGIELSLTKILKGRYIAEDIKNDSGEVLFKKGHYMSKDDAEKVSVSGVKTVVVRSPMTCEAIRGVCVHCYGADLGRNEIIDIGEAVGTVAAQAIGEPGTQLTMRTFHAGGIASAGGDITQGLPRVEELFENRTPKNAAVIAHVEGIVSEIKKEGADKTIVLLPEIKSEKGDKVEYSVPPHRVVVVKIGDKVAKGDLLTDGSADLDELFKYAGKEKTQEYLIREISKIYELQGEAVSRKHMEVILKQMFSRRKITTTGDTEFSRNDIVEFEELLTVNAKMREEGKEEAQAEEILMGIAEVSLSRKSVLAAASFQHTTRVLITNALRAKDDELVGLKENVIIGRLIPAGTGFPGSKKFQAIEALEKELDEKFRVYGNISQEE